MFQLFHLSQGKGASLQQQLREQIAGAILNGNIPLQKPLPSSRKMAQQLNVARNTVVIAYEHLLDDGYIIAKERCGYFVNPDILNGKVKVEIQDPNSDVKINGNAPDWQQRFKLNPSNQCNVIKPKDWQNYDYPFIYGQFDSSMFPTVNWRECCKDAVSGPAINEWAADRFDKDDPLLIEQIRTRLLPRRGVWASADEILVTVGAQQALYMLVKLLLDKNSTIGLEEPGYVDIRNIASLNPSKIKSIPVDSDGMLVGDVLSDCDLVYTTPSHQCPSTVTMPLERRYQLLQQASDEDFIIIEDDYESETNFNSNPIPALKSLDENDRVIYVGSLSKTLAPGLRLGYIVGPAEFIKEARALRRLILRHPAANNQRSVALFLERGYHDSLIMNIMRNYQTRWRAMDEALTKYLPESHDQPTFGGSCYWVKGPENLDAGQLQQLAREQSILIEAGEIHFLQQPAAKNYFRLGFSSIATDKIEPGIKKLAELIHSIV
ncbi:MAG: regulatory protein GntR, HTH:Aminotransferase, class I and II [Osedax symbiont Rs2]|nr:MAG: regulatory protein GntR, HTH:Aminotransferase, class I and II [Osedax symbiont Rs2]